jgi:2-polyprenyl-6-hydroxyphenyl methylase/3-demethylubiquinone-9 3-methyltransferase
MNVMAETTNIVEKRFAFGKNWESFLAHYLTQERIDEACKYLVEFTGISDFRGKSFIDIGCGSGLFSYAAYLLGAFPIYSFDIDKDSVQCCDMMKRKVGNPANWTVVQGSILDEDYLKSLEQFDIVYSWGVLHHTGKMWKAIENSAKLVKEGGLFYLAIYNKADGLAIYPNMGIGPSRFWEKEKRFYCRIPLFFQNIIDYILMIILILAYLVALKNPVKKIRDHKQLRGMSWRIDIKDWLGGYPYEYATVAEVFKFMKFRGFSLENLKCNNGLLNNEYLFKKMAQTLS